MTPSEEKNELELLQLRITITKLLAEQMKLNRENKLGFVGLPAVATIIAALVFAIVTLSIAILRH